MTTTWWYYDSNGQKQGPVSGGELKGLAKTGRISPGTMIEAESGKIVPAVKIKGLTFIAPETILAEAAPPKSARPVESEIYGVASASLEPSPFTASASAAKLVANPFTAAPPAMAKPANNPFTAPMPTANRVIPQSESVSDWAVYAGYAAWFSLIIVCAFVFVLFIGI